MLLAHQFLMEGMQFLMEGKIQVGLRLRKYLRMRMMWLRIMLWLRGRLFRMMLWLRGRLLRMMLWLSTRLLRFGMPAGGGACIASFVSFILVDNSRFPGSDPHEPHPVVAGNE